MKKKVYLWRKTTEQKNQDESNGMGKLEGRPKLSLYGLRKTAISQVEFNSWREFQHFASQNVFILQQSIFCEDQLAFDYSTLSITQLHWLSCRYITAETARIRSRNLSEKIILSVREVSTKTNWKPKPHATATIIVRNFRFDSSSRLETAVPLKRINKLCDGGFRGRPATDERLKGARKLPLAVPRGPTPPRLSCTSTVDTRWGGGTPWAPNEKIIARITLGWTLWKHLKNRRRWRSQRVHKKSCV